MTPEYLRQLAQKMMDTAEFQETVVGCAETLRSAASRIEHLERRFEGPRRLVAVGRPLSNDPSSIGIAYAVRVLIGDWVVCEYNGITLRGVFETTWINRAAADIYAALIGLERVALWPGEWQGEIYLENQATVAFLKNAGKPQKGLRDIPELMTVMARALHRQAGRDITWHTMPEAFLPGVSEHYEWCLTACTHGEWAGSRTLQLSTNERS